MPRQGSHAREEASLAISSPTIPTGNISGSLYVLAITGTTAFGAITPFGGVALLAGWACLILAAVALG